MRRCRRAATCALEKYGLMTHWAARPDADAWLAQQLLRRDRGTSLARVKFPTLRFNSLKTSRTSARIIHLLVEPDILHAPAVEDAVAHDRQALDIGALAGAAAAVENDRPHIVVGQLALDRP